MNWTDEYREIIEFYYWEPQHLGRAKGPRKYDGPAPMWNHINGLEVSLNHILNIFFSLYGNPELFNKLDYKETYDYVSSRQVELWQKDIGGFTQPDIYFLSKKSNLAIELKLGSKTNLDQITKYLVFNHCVGGNKPLNLILMSPHDSLAQITKERFASIAELLATLNYSRLTPKMQSLCDEQAFNKQLAGLNLSLVSLASFTTILESLVTQNQTEQKLLSGTIEYLRGRGY